MMQSDIAKYAMWLFNRTSAPCEQLPALYDHLCQKNPVRSESFSFQDFEALFQQWRWQQLTDGNGINRPAHAEAESGPSQPDRAASCDEAKQMLSPDVAPITDYHVVTEMLIEQLVLVVKRHLTDGWIPLGGVSRASSASSASYWAQALVKRQVN